MMTTCKVALFGHRDLSSHDEVETRLLRALYELAKIYDFVEIYLGRNGEFDVFSASVVKRAQKTCDSNIEMILVLPYVVKDIEYYESYYDRIIIPECVERVYPKGAITKRNRWMVEMSDLVICYVERKSGGAYAAIRYAEMLGKKLINLAYMKDNKTDRGR